MSAEDLETYRFQLEQVDLELKNDPNNEELLKLQTDLKELISMVEQFASPAQQQQSPVKKQNAPNSTPLADPTPTVALKHHEFAVDQEVMARWSGDGQFYRAVITAIGGADQVFSVKFKGYTDSELVKAEDIRPLDVNSLKNKKRRTGIFEDVVVEPENKKGDNKSKRQKTTTTSQKSKTAEFENKKNAWLNFAKGGSKKKKTNATSVINKKSIFKSPDNPEGKVGVVNSGKGMTSFHQRGKHVYEPSGATED
ncbi:hypothetical protein BDF20DRAFT_824059 [Mycotypha africana]|uniref:uncharacterized protein n=1 Tax=Mycotypha africana TaxID=64632 RepID=UPI002300E44A|nr:uncharacterized protein BDF20DRAFT_824059 [Mycotypha africana]KAI8973728.1 hypothetical protein BDF20DRAFT_824059 [Mycotypha africana]